MVGCGYVGCRVACRWRDAGHHVTVTTRSSKRASRFRDEGFEPWLADVTQPETLTGLGNYDTALFAVGFDRSQSEHKISDVYVDGLRNVLTAVHNVDRLLYISSTGVYGQSDGEWIDEESECSPTREGGRACLEAERQLSAHRLGRLAIILRLAGIYGPDRIPQRDALVRGKVRSLALDTYLNLIHVEDAVDCILAAESQSSLPNLFNVSDGTPLLRRDYYGELLQLSGLAADTLEPLAETSGARGSKRVSNAKLKRELDVRLRYTDFRVGLRDALDGSVPHTSGGKPRRN